ncbi:MAG TPA: haloacid dehalogenase-like hydrolase [Streptosporangiaceae bacterium]|nr:haloacid dehalogenase-like hydrolase [Streptosporangiaceae bacterium]
MSGSGLLVLWDVDFTLVDTRGVGTALYRLAFAELYGRELPDHSIKVDMGGRTDKAIAIDVLGLAGIEDPPAEATNFEAMLGRLAPSVSEMVIAQGRALPGAKTAIAALASAGVLQSLLTGNVKAMAAVKLTPFGLTEHLDLDIGAYGDESAVRADLVHLARDRAQRACGTDFSGEATVLIGDTPLDVEAALATGARAVGVATGRPSFESLEAAGAHAVLTDLTDSGQVLAAVLGSVPSQDEPGQDEPGQAYTGLDRRRS